MKATTAPAIRRAPNIDPTTAPAIVPVFGLLAFACKFPPAAVLGAVLPIGVPAEGIGKVPMVVAPMNG